MAKNNAQVISEYVVKLGASMDNNSLNQFLTALDTTKMRAMGLTAAIGALTTGIYKFISSITKQQFEMERLAYQKQKSIKDTWAEQQALKAMGKTLNEINQDKALKSMYDDLVKFNKGLELPNADRAFEKVRSLQGAFYKLKSGVNYAIQAIGNQVLVNLEEPINRITEKVGNIAEWLKNNLTNVATKLGSLITAFSKGIIAIVEGIEKIGKWISSLPDSIKIVAAALTGVIALLSSGPIGKIIAAITLIGDIIHDAEVYKWNQQNTDIFFAEDGSPTKSLENAMKDENGDPILFKVPVGLEPIWDVTIGKKGGNLTDVISGFGEKVGKGAGDLINGAFEEISKAVSGASEGGIASTTLDAIKGIVIGFVKLIVTTIKTIEFEDFGGAIGDIVTWILGLLEQALGEITSLAVELLGGDGSGGEGSNPIVDLLTGLFKSLERGAANLSIKRIGESLGKVIGTIFTKAGQWLSSSGSSAGSAVAELFNGAVTLAGGLLDAIVAGLEELVNSGGISKFVDGVFEFFGNAIHDLFERLTSDPTDENHLDLSGKLGELGEKVGKVIGDAIKLGANFLSTFIQDTITWISEHGDEFLEIGKKIVEAIIEGMSGLFDAIMTSIFGDDWLRIKKKQQTTEEFKELFTDEETGEKKTVVGKSGTVYSEEYANEVLKTSEDAGWIRRDLGLDEATEDQAEIDALLDALGIGNLETNGDYRTLSSAGTKTPEQAVAEAFGAEYYNGSITHNSGYTYAGDMNFGAIVKSIADATTKEELLKALDSLNDFIEDFNKNIYYEYGVHGEIPMFDMDNPGGANNRSRNGPLGVIASTAGIKGLGAPPSGSGGKSTDASEDIKELANKAYAAASYVGDLGDEAKEAKDHVSKFGELTGGSEHDVQGLGEAAAAAAGELAKIKAPTLGGLFGKLFGAQGGRYGTPTDIQIGEDGTEYLIPITKPERAFALINQMLNEMGSSAISRVMTGLGLGQNGTIGASAMSVSSAMSGMNLSPVYNINAPVNINVQSTGADAREIGSNIYDMAERHLIRNVMGVYA